MGFFYFRLNVFSIFKTHSAIVNEAATYHVKVVLLHHRISQYRQLCDFSNLYTRTAKIFNYLA